MCEGIRLDRLERLRGDIFLREGGGGAVTSLELKFKDFQDIKMFI